MKVGITGAYGFIGWHLRCYLSTLENISILKLANRETFSKTSSLENFVYELDVIFHLAGVNRADDSELLLGNSEPAKLLANALKSVGSSATVLFSSSTYAETADNAYGKGKATASQILSEWASNSNGKVVNLIIPHVFGEYGKPFYNSAIATFCHQIANGSSPSIIKDNQLELIHVQDLVETFLKLANEKAEGNHRIHGRSITVIEVAERLQNLYKEYTVLNRLPNLDAPFDRCLFNTLRGAISVDNRIITPTKHKDQRGWLVETVKAGSGGQCFVSTTKPGITRGNHFHRRKVERFFVLQGKGRIHLRKLLTNKVITYDLDGESPSFVDIPTLHTHSITNIGDNELITLFWADEFFDPENPDTFFEEVIKNGLRNE